MNWREGLLIGGMIALLSQMISWVHNDPIPRVPAVEHFVNRLHLGWMAQADWEPAITICRGQHRYRTALSLVDRIPDEHPLARRREVLRRSIIDEARKWIYPEPGQGRP